MLLSELISKLQTIQLEHGDGKVTLVGCERGEWEIEKVEYGPPEKEAEPYTTIWSFDCLA